MDTQVIRYEIYFDVAIVLWLIAAYIASLFLKYWFRVAAHQQGLTG